ncbi:hypothetical protein ACH5RR_021146 [Cinchona calisaya]|uniref:FAF domain-containing protein n=1 Tax=Cinchona calisaya TaxID=153742 RepID=A0ABD2ZJE4_9GENT
MAAACGSLQHIFDNPLPESPTLFESLSPWKHIKNMKPIEDSSFTEIFGELHFKENKVVVVDESSSISSSSSPDLVIRADQSSPCSSFSSSFSSSLLADLGQQNDIERPLDNKNERSYFPTSGHKKPYQHSDSFSSMNSESLSLCTEGLGFESSDDVEDLGKETSFDINHQPVEERFCFCKNSKRSRTSKGSFPPPISCISRTGKPWVCFKSYRQDGRFILQEIRFPTQEFLHACREDGRLRLQLIQSDDEILEGDEDEEGDYYDDDEEDDSEDVNLQQDDDDCEDENKNHQNIADRREIEENDAE